MSTPCLSTLSRSTAMNCCGTRGRNVVFTVAISGRFRAAARNLSTLAARNSMSPPARSSRTNVNPPEVPTPGIAGGENENATPWGRRGELPVQALADELVLLLALLAVLPLLQGDEEEGVVARPCQAQQAEPDDAGSRLNPGSPAPGAARSRERRPRSAAERPRSEVAGSGRKTPGLRPEGSSGALGC